MDLIPQRTQFWKKSVSLWTWNRMRWWKSWIYPGEKIKRINEKILGSTVFFISMSYWYVFKLLFLLRLMLLLMNSFFFIHWKVWHYFCSMNFIRTMWYRIRILSSLSVALWKIHHKKLSRKVFLKIKNVATLFGSN